MTVDPEKAAFTRRAAALLVHRGNADLAGFQAVLDEVPASEAPRLILAILDLVESLLPVIYTAPGLDLVRGAVVELAQLEHGAGGTDG